MRAPSKEICARWVKDAWASVTKETIARSFKTAGITTATDGSEDGLIKCLFENEELAQEVRLKLYGEEDHRSDECIDEGPEVPETEHLRRFRL